MKALKFGGTSVGSPEAIGRIIDILKDREHAGKTAVVVVSAFSGVTDALIAMARQAAAGEDSWKIPLKELGKRHRDAAARFLADSQRKAAVSHIESSLAELSRILDGIALLTELSPRTLDLVMSFGERLSAELLAAVFSAAGLASAFLDTRPLIKTNDQFGGAQYLPKETFANIRAFFGPGPVKLQILKVAVPNSDSLEQPQLGILYSELPHNTILCFDFIL
jgi:aspartokinase/homoserine dehydrogenase 1